MTTKYRTRMHRMNRWQEKRRKLYNKCGTIVRLCAPNQSSHRNENWRNPNKTSPRTRLVIAGITPNLRRDTKKKKLFHRHDDPRPKRGDMEKAPFPSALRKWSNLHQSVVMRRRAPSSLPSKDALSRSASPCERAYWTSLVEHQTCSLDAENEELVQFEKALPWYLNFHLWGCRLSSRRGSRCMTFLVMNPFWDVGGV